ncbi:hypothetical protein GF376_01260 [Candidatus Peregrinibacteria bacterium]|nr:hypothetical protein [Candidatus Peregrinibacteria bacterium]
MLVRNSKRILNKKKILIIVTVSILLIIVGVLAIQRNANAPAPEFYGNDNIKITYPLPGETVSSPLRITGSAESIWFFEASFPVTLKNSQNQIITQSVAQAKENWMQEGMIEFEATLDFDTSEIENSEVILLLENANPSGLPENAKSIEYKIFIN